MGRATPSALLLLAVFLPSLWPAAAAPQSRPPVSHLQVLTNFECVTKVSGHLSKPRCRWKLRENLSVPVPTFAISTVEPCQHEYQACVRVRLALNATGIQGLELRFLVLSTNRFASLRILRREKHQANSGTLWQVQFNCFPAMRGQKVVVSLETIPPGALTLSRYYFVPNKQSEPKFSYQWLPEERAIEVSVPEDSSLTVRLCYKLALECEELRQAFHQEVLVSRNHTAVLPYELLLPCLCIEAYKHRDGLRKKVCPFQDQPEAYGPELWSSMDFQDYSRSDRAEMAMSLSGRCPLPPTASLCWKERAAPEAVCQDIPNSTFKRLNQEYILEEVDVHPQLCFKFSYANNSHVECPHRANAAWNVSLSLKFLQFHLNFYSRIPASFSAALCQQQSRNQCELEPPIYTITHTKGLGPENMNLILPWHAMRSCVLVWRSDVRFAGKQLLCPDVSHRHWGLLASALGLGLGILVAIILLICWNLHRLHQDKPKKHHSHPILLIYSPDSEEYKQLVCAFAALLRSALGCPVLLDLWEMANVGRLGILPWMYAQREHVSQEQGRVLLLWSPGSARAYGLWQGQANGDSRKAAESHDLFGAAMACLQGELQNATKQQNWVIAYFGKLCGRGDIPHALRLLTRYRLPQELPGLVRVLQGPSGAVPSWLHTSAKALVGHLLKAEKKKDSRNRLYQTWRTTTEQLAGPFTPLTRPKLRKADCT